MKKFKLLLAFFTILFYSFYGFSQSTKVVVRAKAKDAKFIGTAIGGASVIIRNDLTGEILAKGITSGASGSTDLIMLKPQHRGAAITDDKTAGFEASITIDEPTFVTIEVVAPLNRKNAAITVKTQVWLIPGKDIEGEGIVLEIPGFIVDILYPQTHQAISLQSLENKKLTVKANLVMMCGCPISKGGVWNSDDIEVKAIVKKEGVKWKEAPLNITNQNNVFDGILEIVEKGSYELQLYAYDKKTGNTGVDKINFVVQ